jgi:hypothetical protein
MRLKSQLKNLDYIVKQQTMYQALGTYVSYLQYNQKVTSKNNQPCIDSKSK